VAHNQRLMQQIESKIQQACIKWFRAQFPKYNKRLFAVPNEGQRTKANASRMKAQGMVSGVSDIIFLLPRGQYHGLCIEMKAQKGRQTDNQKEFEEEVKGDYKYVLCYSFDEFMNIIKDYLAT